MSFKTLKQTHGNQAVERDESLCRSQGCKCKGTVDNGGGFMCFVHANAKDWRTADDVLRDNQHILLGIDETLGIGETEWCMGKWSMMEAYFDEPELKPTEAERQHKRWYEYRLRNWMLYLAGACRRPVARPALVVTNKFGRVAI